MGDVFDALLAFDREMQRVRQVKELRAEIAAIGLRCGDCQHWMKSRTCPRERNVNGMSRGPSAGGAICASFVETATATQRRQDKAALLRSLQGEAP